MHFKEIMPEVWAWILLNHTRNNILLSHKVKTYRFAELQGRFITFSSMTSLYVELITNF